MAARLAGVDGCRAGWFLAFEDEAGLTSRVVERFDEIADLVDGDGVVAVDIPIGLPDSGRRRCDVAARARIGPRYRSVFPAPIRPALEAPTRAEADRIARRIDGRGVSAQSFAIYPKIREVDRVLQARPDARRWIREVHPEVSFTAWNGRPMNAGKATPAGARSRRRLVDAVFGPEATAEARERHLKKDLADDDILDAFAALWSARRVAAGLHGRLPAPPDPVPVDATGLRMEIVF